MSQEKQKQPWNTFSITNLLFTGNTNEKCILFLGESLEEIYMIVLV